MTDAHRGAEPVIVLLHGATSSARIWNPVLPELTSRYRVLVPTLAGHLGGRPMPAGGANVIEKIVDDVCGQLDDAGVEMAHLVGNSLGGWVALELARRGRAQSVLGFSPAGSWKTAADLQRMLAIFRVGAILRRSRRLPKLAADPRLRRVLLRAMAEHADRLSAAQTADVFEDMAGCDVLPSLLDGARAIGRIQPLSARCPIRIVWGASDRTLPFARYGRPLLSALDGAELVFLAGVGHVPMIDDPAAVAATITRFVDEMAPRTS